MANFITTAPVAPEDWELFIEPFLDDPLITDMPFDFIDTKFVKRKMYFGGELSGAAYQKEACGWNFEGGVGFTSKDLEPVEFARAIEQCYIPLVNTIFANGLPDGWHRGELSPEVRDYMQKQLAHAFNMDLVKTLFLGDDALSTNPYQIKDGIYKSLKEGAVAGDGTIDAGVTLNATSLNQDNFLNTMLSVYEKMPSRMRRIVRSQKSMLTWIWTDTVYAAYQAFAWTKTQNNAGIIQRDSILNGDDLGTFLGIPITVVPFVDDALASDFPVGSPPAGEDPYRVILTKADNHKVLMDNGGFKDINTWYNPDLDLYRATVSALMEYKYAYGYYNLFSGF